MAHFIESPRFDGCPSAGFTSSADYRVVITRRASGVEKRNRAWAYPLTTITATIGPRHQSEIQRTQDWWHSTGGGAIGFRVQDRSDYLSCHVGQTPLNTDQPLLALGGGVHQLIKRYQVGIDEDSNPVYQDRIIYKPVPTTVTLSGAGSVDYTTGLVTGASDGTTWGGEFDLPMRFSPESGFPVEVMTSQIQSVSFVFVEIRFTAE